MYVEYKIATKFGVGFMMKSIEHKWKTKLGFYGRIRDEQLGMKRNIELGIFSLLSFVIRIIIFDLL